MKLLRRPVGRRSLVLATVGLASVALLAAGATPAAAGVVVGAGAVSGNVTLVAPCNGGVAGIPAVPAFGETAYSFSSVLIQGALVGSNGAVDAPPAGFTTANVYGGNPSEDYLGTDALGGVSLANGCNDPALFPNPASGGALNTAAPASFTDGAGTNGNFSGVFVRCGPLVLVALNLDVTTGPLAGLANAGPVAVVALFQPSLTGANGPPGGPVIGTVPFNGVFAGEGVR